MKILRDKNVDMKMLKKIIRTYQLKVEIIDANIENFTKKVKQEPALAVLGRAKLLMRLPDQNEARIFERITSIIGKEKIGDVIHTHEALYHKVDYLISQDNDILSKRKELEDAFENLQILKLEEFEDILRRG